MGNLFDNFQEVAHAIVAKTMGYSASWQPSTGGVAITGTVLFNRPTQKAEVTDEAYAAITAKMEYLEPDFPGLADAVRANRNEIIIINGVSYYGYRVDKTFDGKTTIIHLEPQI